MPFHGTFEHNLDAKNRLTVPAKFRTDLRDGIFLVRGEDPCLSIYPAAAYEEIIQSSLSALNPMSRPGRQARRWFYSRADQVELDSAGRITLAANQLQHAGIEGREVVLTGAGVSLDVWSPAGWSAFDAAMTANPPEIPETLGHTA